MLQSVLAWRRGPRFKLDAKHARRDEVVAETASADPLNIAGSELRSGGMATGPDSRDRTRF